MDLRAHVAGDGGGGGGGGSGGGNSQIMAQTDQATHTQVERGHRRK